MMRDDKDVKHVIILDESRPHRTEPETDEPEELLKEPDEYAEDEGKYKKKAADKPSDAGPAPVRKNHISQRHGKLILALGVSLFILAAVLLFAVWQLDPGYREPVKIYEEYLNKEDLNGEELSYAYGNGLARRSFEKLREVQHGYEDYNMALEASADTYRAEYDRSCARYGEDRKYSITVNEAVPLTDGELLVIGDDLEGIISDLAVSSYARAADPELSSALKQLTDKMKDAKISGGYRLYCTQNISGSLSDGPVSVVNRCEFTVIKLDGHWIMWDKIYDIFRMTF